MNLELAATCWLVNQKRCMLVTQELSPRSNYCGEPDAYGVTAARYAIEVEVKRSMSDFYADRRKRSRRNREFFPQWFPKFFYYLVPNEISKQATAALPEWAGLLSLGSYGVVDVLVESPKNKASKRLSIKECVRLAQQMAIHSTRVESKMDGAITAWKNGCEPYHWNYQI